MCQFISVHDVTWHDMKKLGENKKKRKMKTNPMTKKGGKGINKKKSNCVSLGKFMMWHDMTWQGKNKQKKKEVKNNAKRNWWKEYVKKTYFRRRNKEFAWKY